MYIEWEAADRQQFVKFTYNRYLLNYQDFKIKLSLAKQFAFNFFGPQTSVVVSSNSSSVIYRHFCNYYSQSYVKQIYYVNVSNVMEIIYNAMSQIFDKISYQNYYHYGNILKCDRPIEQDFNCSVKKHLLFSQYQCKYTFSYQLDINIILDGIWPWLFEFGDWLRHAHCTADQIQTYILHVNIAGVFEIIGRCLPMCCFVHF